MSEVLATDEQCEALPVVDRQALEELQREWLPIWLADSKQAVEGWALSDTDVLPLRVTLHAYSVAAGLGWGNFNPRQLALLPNRFLQRFLDVLTAREDNP